MMDGMRLEPSPTMATFERSLDREAQRGREGSAGSSAMSWRQMIRKNRIRGTKNFTEELTEFIWRNRVQTVYA